MLTAPNNVPYENTDVEKWKRVVDQRLGEMTQQSKEAFDETLKLIWDDFKNDIKEEFAKAFEDIKDRLDKAGKDIKEFGDNTKLAFDTVAKELEKFGNIDQFNPD